MPQMWDSRYIIALLRCIFLLAELDRDHNGAGRRMQARGITSRPRERRSIAFLAVEGAVGGVGIVHIAPTTSELMQTGIRVRVFGGEPTDALVLGASIKVLHKGGDDPCRHL